MIAREGEQAEAFLDLTETSHQSLATMARPPRTFEGYADSARADYADSHLAYELEMLAELAKLPLSEPSSESRGEWAARMARIESFAIHLRNVIKFLEPAGTHPDDVYAVDFLAAAPTAGAVPFTLAGTLPPLWKRASQEVAHFTINRQATPAAAKEWNVAVLEDLKKPLEEFRDSAATDRIGPKTRKAIDDFLTAAFLSQPPPTSFASGAQSVSINFPGQGATHSGPTK